MTLRYTMDGSIHSPYVITADGQELVGHADYEHEAMEAAVKFARKTGEAVIHHEGGLTLVLTIEVQHHGGA